jgi:lipid-binding SYLF domain-containing protein
VKKTTALVSIALLLVFVASLGTDDVLAGKKKAGEKRAKIDAMSKETLDRLFEEFPKSRKLYESAYGYAVFDNTKVSLMITGGGGVGVAVNRGSGNRTYMKMATAGLNLGLGAQVYQVVFLFEDAQTFDTFVNTGWEAEASANAVAGPAGANAGTVFRNGMAVYQFTEGGLMLQADISGTKYWKSKKLNR